MKRYSLFMHACGLLAVVCLLAFAGCGAKEAPAPPPQKVEPMPPVTEPPAPKAAEPVPAPVAQPATGAVAPLTLPMLRLMPESAMFALAIPPLNGIVDKALALAKRIAPADFNVDEEVGKAISDIGKDIGTPDAKTFPDIAVAKGIQPDAPIGIFVDLTPTAVSAKEAFVAIAPALEAQKVAAAPKEGEKKEGENKDAVPAPPA